MRYYLYLLVGVYVWAVSSFLSQLSPRPLRVHQRINSLQQLFLYSPQLPRSPLPPAAIPTLNDLGGLPQGEDVDHILKDLVSPAPESFLVIQGTVINLNNNSCNKNGDGADNLSIQSFILDLSSISQSLVKPGRALHLYREKSTCDWKWKTMEDAGGLKLSCREEGIPKVVQSLAQLYHSFTTLELAHMAAGQKDSNKPNELSVEDIAFQIEKRLILTWGSDLRGTTSSDAAFQLALSGIRGNAFIFEAIIRIAIHELKRTGCRSSFQSNRILQMVEKFAACGITSASMLELYANAAECLQKKRFYDEELIASLRNGSFGLHSDRPLLWLWRFSARQKKIVLADVNNSSEPISWSSCFEDASKGLVVDIGCGLGVSLLNLSAISSHEPQHMTVDSKDLAHMKWGDYNYVGADLNHQLINYANGVISRRNEIHGKKRVEFFCIPALQLLSDLKSYPGKIELITIHFPSPFVLQTVTKKKGNAQLPQSRTDGFMIPSDVAMMIAELLNESLGSLVFQTQCEDVAVYAKMLLLDTGSLECVHCVSPVEDVDARYRENSGIAPKRVQEWLNYTLDAERAEGKCWSSIPLMPAFGKPETEVNCEFQNTVVHQCLFSPKSTLAVND